MARKPTYEELINKLETLEMETQQRKRAEKAQRRAEALSSAPLNASADSAVLMDVSGSMCETLDYLGGIKIIGIDKASNIN
ncbi:MAG: hypothetical protein PVI06_04160 [Desulfobacterales bacterium]